MPATSFFNSSLTAFAISSADELGLFDELQDTAKVDLDAFVTERGLHAPSVRALVDVLAHAGVVVTTQAERGILAKGHEFDDVWLNKGYFRWLIRGYGKMLSRAADFCDPAFRDSTDPLRHRDGRAIAIAGKDYGGHFTDPVVDEIVDGLDFSVGIDLGCGSANRIIRLARCHPDKRFIGVDVDRGAVDVAREAVASAGLTARITIVHDDVRDLSDRPEYATADLAVSFFLGHDFWPRKACLRTLAQLRRRLPQVRDFLFSDTYRSPGLDGGQPTVFTLGFELTHALMGQHVPTLAEWVDLFDESVWDLRDRRSLGIAYSDIFHLVPRASLA
jgi:phenylpyruvate C(3)-methyltransferase